MNRNVLKSINAFAIVVAAYAAHAQTQGKASTPITAGPGPSMTETKALIERQLPLAGDFSVVIKGTDPNDRPLTSKYDIKKATVTDCRLTVDSTRQPFYHDPELRFMINKTHLVVPLKDIDVSKIEVAESSAMKGFVQSRPYFRLKLAAAADRGTPFAWEIQGPNQPAKPGSGDKLALILGDEVAGKSVAAALRRAAILCGAEDLPPAVTSAETSSPGSNEPVSAKPTDGRITNADVLKLVAAGLSDSIVSTSIRQAVAKEFDLTPTGLIALKKGGVSDAVIGVMQERAGPLPTSSAAEATPAPRYDSSLERAPVPVAPPVPSNGCEGIEAMGIYKNQAMSTAMGGGIVEWLAKIRNNTGVTKIVIFSWQDKYGQQQKAQVQLRGGDIASPRLEMTQSVFIPPVKYLQLVSCQ